LRLALGFAAVAVGSVPGLALGFAAVAVGCALVLRGFVLGAFALRRRRRGLVLVLQAPTLRGRLGIRCGRLLRFVFVRAAGLGIVSAGDAGVGGRGRRRAGVSGGRLRVGGCGVGGVLPR